MHESRGLGDVYKRQDEISRLADADLRERLVEGVRNAGFRFVTVDLAGYARGSSNPLAMGRG